ncbi:hypothetical protein D3C77_464790 [compost metagenome]
MPRQVRRSRYQNPVRRGQLASDNALRQVETTTNSSIESLTDQVDLAIIKMPVRIDCRKTLQKLSQQRHDV